MVVASANEFRVSQKKYLDLVKRDIQVFIKRGSDLFAITTVAEDRPISFNPVWVDHMNQAEQDIKRGKITAIKSNDIWKKVMEADTP